MTTPGNIAASVKTRLQNVATKRGEDFNLLLVRYAIERLLFRLSQSRHRDRFLLKGAMLFLIWDERTHRPTRDVDLLGFGPSDREDLIEVFQTVATTSVIADGLVFDPDSVQAEEIREDNAYGGIRVRLLGKLGQARIPVQIDVGVGDAVTPGPETAAFPVLLDFPAPTVRAYPIYTVVAEKFEAMVKLGHANTRMKDFYDLWFMSRRFDFDRAILRRAIEATFDRRQTKLPVWPGPLSNALADDPAKQAQWTAFLRRNALSAATNRFADVVAALREFLEPVVSP